MSESEHWVVVEWNNFDVSVFTISSDGFELQQDLKSASNRENYNLEYFINFVFFFFSCEFYRRKVHPALVNAIIRRTLCAVVAVAPPTTSKSQLALNAVIPLLSCVPVSILTCKIWSEIMEKQNMKLKLCQYLNYLWLLK